MHPIDEYIKGYDAYKKGKKVEAADALAKSLGGEGPTAPILRSLETIFQEDTLAHDAVLDTVVSEVRRREKDGGK